MIIDRVKALSSDHYSGLYIENQSQVIVLDSLIAGNDNYGIYVDSSSIEIINTEVSQNQVGGIYAYRDNDIRVVSSQIKDNSLNYGGRAGIYVGDRTDLYLENSAVIRNPEGIRVNTVNGTTGTVTITHSVIAYNREEGIYLYGSGEHVDLS